MPRRTIGNYYDAERFDNIINKAALELVKSTMGDDAETDKGREFLEQAKANLKANFSSLSVIYYQALEAFVDGKVLDEYLKNSHETIDVLSTLNNGSFIDIVLACGDGKLTVKNEKAALGYYNRRFPEAQTDLEAEAGPVETETAEDQRRDRVRPAETLENIVLRRAMSAYEKARSMLDKAGAEDIQRATEELHRRSQRLSSAKERAIISARKRLDGGRMTEKQYDMRIAEIEREYSLYEAEAEAEKRDTPHLDRQIREQEAEKTPDTVEADSVNKYQIDFKGRNIEIDTYVPQTPISHTGAENKKALDGGEKSICEEL